MSKGWSWWLMFCGWRQCSEFTSVLWRCWSNDRTDGKFVKLFCIPNLSLSEQVEKEPTNHTHTTRMHARTHRARARLTALCLGLPGWAGTRKAKPIWILLKQETASGSGISWAICKSAPRFGQITTPAPHRCFLQAGCPSCRPANSVKVLKAVFSSEQVEKEPTNQLIQIHLKNSG